MRPLIKLAVSLVIAYSWSLCIFEHVAQWIGCWAQHQKVWNLIPTAGHGNAGKISHSILPLPRQQ